MHLLVAPECIGPSLRSEFVTFSNVPKFGVASKSSYDDKKRQTSKKSQTLSMTGLRGGKNPKRETVVESHPLRFPPRFARGFRKKRQALAHMTRRGWDPRNLDIWVK